MHEGRDKGALSRNDLIMEGGCDEREHLPNSDDEAFSNSSSVLGSDSNRGS